MNANKSYISAENMPGQAAFSPALLIDRQTSDVHYSDSPEEEVNVRPRQFVSASMTSLDNLGATLNEY